MKKETQGGLGQTEKEKRTRYSLFYKVYIYLHKHRERERENNRAILVDFYDHASGPDQWICLIPIPHGRWSGVSLCLHVCSRQLKCVPSLFHGAVLTHPFSLSVQYLDEFFNLVRHPLPTHLSRARLSSEPPATSTGAVRFLFLNFLPMLNNILMFVLCAPRISS